MKPDLGKPVPSSEITPEARYHRRREFLKRSVLFAATATGVGTALLGLIGGGRRNPPSSATTPDESISTNLPTFTVASKSRFSTSETWTSYADVTSYNNFYEFGTGKEDPARNAHTLRPRPWTVAIEGEVGRPQVVDIDRILGWFPLEERVYRMRCVEGWSMVIPWVGFPLGELIRRAEPTSRAKFVSFRSLLDTEQMPDQRRRVLEWPYAEALRLDEAMHPLTILAAGLYGKPLPGQNGAPLRLVVPWKYGFKGIKSIVAIRLTQTQPATSWNDAAPDEYGIFANVNPAVDHPRWTQAKERRIGEFRKRETLMFNGYAEQVASMYSGMDLRKNY